MEHGLISSIHGGKVNRREDGVTNCCVLPRQVVYTFLERLCVQLLQMITVAAELEKEVNFQSLVVAVNSGNQDRVLGDLQQRR